MTDEQLADLRARITPGPWYRDAWDIRASGPGTGAICEVAAPNGDDNQFWQHGEADANARFIAAAPALLDEVVRLREGLIDCTAHLAAAISLLERGGKAAKKAAPSDKMFDLMLADYRASVERARTALGGAHD